MTKKLLLVIFCFITSSCTNIIRTEPGADAVRLFFLDELSSASQLKNIQSTCRLVGETIGSEGHWYTYLFISNTLLTQGAINELKNDVFRKGGNVAVVYENIDFVTSVTLLGQAYDCTPPEIKDKARF